MPIIDTLVSKSNDTKHAALNLNAKTFQLRRTLAAVWDLDPSTADLPSQESTLSLDSANEPSDTSFASSDGRVKVQPHDLAPEGRYRCKTAVAQFDAISNRSYSSTSNRKTIHFS